MKKIKVRIIKKSNPESWYYDSIGSEFEVYDYRDKYFILCEDYDHPRRNEIAYRLILKDEAEIVFQGNR